MGTSARLLDGMSGLEPVDVTPAPRSRTTFSFLTLQVIGTAQNWATELRDGAVRPEHLVLALVQQGSADVRTYCSVNHIDIEQSEVRAREVLGWPDAPRNLAPLTAAGTLDRPPLVISELPAELWSRLRERQDRLPLTRLRRSWQYEALERIELRTAWRVAARAEVGADVCHSLVWHHHDAVRRLARQAIPGLVDASEQQRKSEGHRLHGRRKYSVPVEWRRWLKNRVDGVRDVWFRLWWRLSL
jgi:hypothetical protein